MPSTSKFANPTCNSSKIARYVPATHSDALRSPDRPGMAKTSPTRKFCTRRRQTNIRSDVDTTATTDHPFHPDKLHFRAPPTPLALLARQAPDSTRVQAGTEMGTAAADPIGRDGDGVPRRPAGVRFGRGALATHVRHGPLGRPRLQAELPRGAADGRHDRGPAPA